MQVVHFLFTCANVTVQSRYRVREWYSVPYVFSHYESGNVINSFIYSFSWAAEDQSWKNTDQGPLWCSLFLVLCFYSITKFFGLNIVIAVEMRNAVETCLVVTDFIQFWNLGAIISTWSACKKFLVNVHFIDLACQEMWFSSTKR